MKKKTRSVTRKKKTTAQNRLQWRTLCNNHGVNEAPPERQSSAVEDVPECEKQRSAKKVRNSKRDTGRRRPQKG
jgi:hypothetical protein